MASRMRRRNRKSSRRSRNTSKGRTRSRSKRTRRSKSRSKRTRQRTRRSKSRSKRRSTKTNLGLGLGLGLGIPLALASGYAGYKYLKGNNKPKYEPKYDYEDINYLMFNPQGIQYIDYDRSWLRPKAQTEKLDEPWRWRKARGSDTFSARGQTQEFWDIKPVQRPGYQYPSTEKFQKLYDKKLRQQRQNLRSHPDFFVVRNVEKDLDTCRKHDRNPGRCSRFRSCVPQQHKASGLVACRRMSMPRKHYKKLFYYSTWSRHGQIKIPEVIISHFIRQGGKDNATAANVVESMREHYFYDDKEHAFRSVETGDIIRDEGKDIPKLIPTHFNINYLNDPEIKKIAKDMAEQLPQQFDKRYDSVYAEAL